MNFVKLSIGCLLVVTGAACSLEPRVDTSGLNPAAAAAAGAGYTSPWGAAPGTPGAVYPNAYACAIDTRTVVENQGHFIEVLTSRGRLFEFENGMPIQTTAGAPAAPAFGYTVPGAAPYAAGGAAYGAIELTSVPLYAQGPCLGFAPGTCVFDTHAFVRLPGNRLLEYITGNGRQWVYENNQMTGAGIPLASIPRYQPICAPVAATGAPCIFDTRVFVKMGAQLVESITAYGRRFELDIDGVPLPNTGIDLMQSPRYAAGPCAGAAPGTCTLETRTFEPGPTGQLVETVTSRGMLFTYAADTGVEVMPPAPVTSRANWANGPCR